MEEEERKYLWHYYRGKLKVHTSITLLAVHSAQRVRKRGYISYHRYSQPIAIHPFIMTSVPSLIRYRELLVVSEGWLINGATAEHTNSTRAGYGVGMIRNFVRSSSILTN